MNKSLLAFVTVFSLCAYGADIEKDKGESVFGDVNKDEIAKLTSSIPTEDDIAKYEEAIRQFKNSGSEQAQNAVAEIEQDITNKLTTGDVSVWTEKDFGYCENIARKLDSVRSAWKGGASNHIDYRVWGRWVDWAAVSENHKEFFSRLMFGFKNKTKITIRNTKAFGQATYRYMSNQGKLFPDLKSKLLFCSQLAAAGVKDVHVVALSKTLAEEAGAK